MKSNITPVATASVALLLSGLDPGRGLRRDGRISRWGFEARRQWGEIAAQAVLTARSNDSFLEHGRDANPVADPGVWLAVATATPFATTTRRTPGSGRVALAYDDGAIVRVERQDRPQRRVRSVRYRGGKGGFGHDGD